MFSFLLLQSYFLKINFTTIENDKTSSISGMISLLGELFSRGFKPKSILDVGANLGGWSKKAKKIFVEADCYMIEPLFEMEDELKKFCKNNPGSKYFLYGAGSKNENMYLTLGGENLAGSNLTFGKSPFLKDRQREIQVITIDSLIEAGEIPFPDFVKMDVQGFELEALKGGQKLFDKAEVFIVETNLFEFMKGMPLVHDVILYMAEKGYVIYDFPGFLRRPYDGALAQMDVCFVKKNGLLRQTNLWFKKELC